MVTSFRETFIIFALIGIFVFASMSFIVQTQIDNDVENTVLENEVINKTFTDLEIDLSNFGSNASSQKSNFDQDIPERGFGDLIIFAVIGVGQGFTGLIVGVYNIFIVLPASILGVPPVVIGVLTSILVMSLILLAWRLYRAGA